MSMGKRYRADGFEQDATTGWKHVLCYMSRPGVSSAAKRQARRRERRQGKAEAKAGRDE